MRKGLQTWTKCPRGDLNPKTGEISLNLDLNSKTGEKSPDRGVHAAMVAGMPRLASNAFRWPAAEPGCRPLSTNDDACQARIGASAVLIVAPRMTQGAVPGSVAGRIARTGKQHSISA